MLGIFDSGIGGLTVVKAIEEAIPGISYVYLGDTARLPYGTKSAETISKYTTNALEFLSSKGATVPIVACHTASSMLLSNGAARKKIESMFQNEHMYNVATSAILEAKDKTKNKKIGILGTSATIRSHAYENALHEFSITSVAASVLVSLAEEDFSDRKYSGPILNEILKPFITNNVDTVILACTHFPILANSIRAILGANIELIDPGMALAKCLATKKNILKKGAGVIYATDIPEDFEERSSRFLGRNIHVKAV